MKKDIVDIYRETGEVAGQDKQNPRVEIEVKEKNESIKEN